jgi:hypothetical protein
MIKRDSFPSIRPADLEGVGGAASRSSTNSQMQTALQSVTDSLNDLKNQNTNGSSSLSKLLPFVVMAKVMRG